MPTFNWDFNIATMLTVAAGIASFYFGTRNDLRTLKQVLGEGMTKLDKNVETMNKVVMDLALSTQRQDNSDRHRGLRRHCRRRRPHHVPLARKRIGKYESLAGCLLHGKQHSSLPVRGRLIATLSRTRHPRNATSSPGWRSKNVVMVSGFECKRRPSVGTPLARQRLNRNL